MTKLNESVRPNVKILSVVLTVVLAIVAISLVSLATVKPAAADTYEEVQAQIEASSADLDKASADYHEAANEASEARRVVEEDNAIIAENEAKTNALKKDMGKYCRQEYMSSSFIELVGSMFSAPSFSDFIRKFDVINEINSKNANTVTEYKKITKETEEKRAQAIEAANLAGEKEAEAAAIKNQAESTVAGLQAKLDALSAEEQARRQAAEQERYNPPEGGGGSGGGGGGVPVIPGHGDAAIVARAQSCVGVVPYVWGGCSPSGADCSGFVSYCCCGSWTRIGTTYTFLGWPQVSNPQPGNVAVNSGHCGIYVGGGQMIHSPCTGQKVSYGGVQGGMIIVQYG